MIFDQSTEEREVEGCQMNTCKEPPEGASADECEPEDRFCGRKKGEMERANKNANVRGLTGYPKMRFKKSTGKMTPLIFSRPSAFGPA